MRKAKFWWGYGSRGEEYGVGPFDSFEAAKADAEGTAPGETVTIGEEEYHDIPWPDAGDVLEQVGCQMDDVVYEAYDRWDISKEAVSDLQQRLDACFEEWMTANGIDKKFMGITQCETINTPEAK